MRVSPVGCCLLLLSVAVCVYGVESEVRKRFALVDGYFDAKPCNHTSHVGAVTGEKIDLAGDEISFPTVSESFIGPRLRVLRQAVDASTAATAATTQSTKASDATTASTAASAATTTSTTTTTPAPTVPPKIAETDLKGLMLPAAATNSSPQPLLNAVLAQLCYNLTEPSSYSGNSEQNCADASSTDSTVTKNGYVLPAPIEALMPNITYEGTFVASYNQFPFYATVFATHNRLTGTLCGGAFIDTKTVVTAASCFFDAKGQRYEEVRVTDGSSAELIVPRYASWLSTSRNVITHNSYSSTVDDMRYNLAVINLVVEATNVGTLPLAKPPNAKELLYPEQNDDSLTVLGFGRISTSTPQMYLRYQHVKPYGTEVCAMVYGGLTCDSTVVTGKNKDTDTSALCNVESGAPLVRKINSQGDLRLYGVGSFIPKRGCGYGALDGYVNVSTFRNWIISNTRYNPSVSEVIRYQPVETFTYTPWGMAF